MKKLIALFSLIPVLVSAQTNTSTNGLSLGLGADLDAVANFLSQGSNWMVAPYGIAYNSGGRTRFGGGIGVGYALNSYVVPTLRLDYLDSHFYMPSGSLQLQLPISPFKNPALAIVPFAFSGVATPIGGGGGNNGSVVGIFGAGAALRIAKHWDVIGDMEKWTTFSGNQYRFGFVYKF